MSETDDRHREPRYVTDSEGNRVGVLLDLDRYRELTDAADELDAIRAYDEAKAAGDEAIPLDDALREIVRAGVAGDDARLIRDRGADATESPPAHV